MHPAMPCRGVMGRAKLLPHRGQLWCSELVAKALMRACILKPDRLPHAWCPFHFAENMEWLQQQTVQGWRFTEPKHLK